MTQHLLIQVYHHCSNNTQNNQNTIAFLPGSAHTPPGEIAPDRLAVLPFRQAPASFQSHCFFFPVTVGRSSTCRQAPLSTVLSHVKPIAWRLSVYRQAPYQNSTLLIYGTSINPIYYTTHLHRPHRTSNIKLSYWLIYNYHM